MKMGFLGFAGIGVILVTGLSAAPGGGAGRVSLLLEDPAAGIAGLEASDCRSVRVESTDAGLEFTVTLGAPIEKGPFTCVHVFIDGDGNPATGIAGNELWFRAAVGSRFRANDWKPDAPGVPAPLSLARLSWSDVGETVEMSTGRRSAVWLHRNPGGAPSVNGPVLAFTIPAGLLSKVADRYGTPPSLRVRVETSCGDQPLFLEYVAADDGLPIQVDGDTRDWSGEPSTSDAGGELWAPVRFLDLTRVRVDHGIRRLFLWIETDVPGFADPPPASGDLTLDQRIEVLVEPVDSPYDLPKRVTFYRGQPGPSGTGDLSAMKDRTVEASIIPRGGGGHVRVLVWSEAIHWDEVPDSGSAVLGAKK